MTVNDDPDRIDKKIKYFLDLISELADEFPPDVARIEESNFPSEYGAFYSASVEKSSVNAAEAALKWIRGKVVQPQARHRAKLAKFFQKKMPLSKTN